MHRHAHCPQVGDAQDTADNIATKVIKDQDFPYRFSFGVEDRRNRCEQGVGLGLVLVAGFDGLVQVQNLLERCWPG